ncbi:short-chain dehydrogenase [Pseudoxanthomonas broegbernensis]|uniref:Short-chain dehydrogenase n=1 Tax=Pseudoxanthomonas broegbernensis TaxID=83619 RepID=A0A7V8K615_9GAMM|nr:SDR family oxidoreductase [Pseudoxanthomonas broegbernensis]KAF1684810.1 short-chain dehydrogenase [Pseudoxanthomonas broegbernensis]MBB6066330.1 short-subunit dehydrogenase [Pseudoxanthomonas broegbernensis]
MKRILIVGAASAIAEHYARREAAAGSALLLAGRSAQRLEAIAADLRVRGAGQVATFVLDVNALERHEALLDAAWSQLGGSVDVVLLAHGTLPDNAACAEDPALALREFATNGTSTLALMAAAARRLEAQGQGTLAVISSVAGDRGRASNYLYGSAKAAVTAYASGLRQRLRGSGVNVLTVKPGFVDTPMTREFRKGLLWASPQAVARGIARAIARRRAVAYLPWFWWGIMRVITHIPEPVFRRLRL